MQSSVEGAIFQRTHKKKNKQIMFKHYEMVNVRYKNEKRVMLIQINK